MSLYFRENVMSNNIEVGTKVIFNGDVLTVERVTPKMFYCGEDRFYKATLAVVGKRGKWSRSSSHCAIATTLLMEQLEYSKLVAIVEYKVTGKVRASNLSNDEVRTLARLIKKISIQ